MKNRILFPSVNAWPEATPRHPAWSLVAVVVLLLAAPRAWAVTPESFARQWRDAAVDERIDANIEKFRKGDALIEIVDTSGKPVADARIEARQIGHEFLFGCNAFVLGQLKTPERNQRYEKAFTRLFNFVTVPFYWEGTEPSKGELRYQEAGSRDIWRRPPPDRFIPFAKKHGLTLKGHPLLWGQYNPPWLPKDPAELRALYQKRFREIASRYGDKVKVFDVVNESLNCATSYPLFTPDHAYVAWAFKQALPLFPDQTILMLNEVTKFNFGLVDENPYLALVKRLLGEGVNVRGIGFQFHMFFQGGINRFMASPDFNPGQWLDIYEKFGEFGLPLYITEITIPSVGKDGENLQAEMTRAFYRLWFSAPKMAGLTWWNLADGTSQSGNNKGGLLAENLMPKAAYRVLDQLINKDWKTHAQIRTDARGQAKFRGFHGKYQVQVIRGGKTRQFEIELGKSGPQAHRLTFKD